MKVIYQHITTVLLVMLLASTFTACEEVIKVELNSSNPVLVADGKIFQDSAAYIRLSLTSDFYSNEPSPIITDASVTLSDNKGNTEDLFHTSNGIYKGYKLIGIPGNTYTIAMIVEEMEYSASSRLFAPVEIYDVTFEESQFKRPDSEEVSYDMTVFFSDNPKEENFYMLQYINNDSIIGSSYSLYPDTFAKNDTMETNSISKTFSDGNYKVNVFSIDEKTYDYYNQLNDISGGGFGGGSTPYNPISNFGNDVMGFFSAMSYTSKEGEVVY